LYRALLTWLDKRHWVCRLLWFVCLFRSECLGV